jgi:hypothetical protein
MNILGKATDRRGMNPPRKMVIYDHWLYMTIFRVSLIGCGWSSVRGYELTGHFLMRMAKTGPDCRKIVCAPCIFSGGCKRWSTFSGVRDLIKYSRWVLTAGGYPVSACGRAMCCGRAQGSLQHRSCRSPSNASAQGLVPQISVIYRLLLDFGIFELAIFPEPDQPVIRKPLCLEDRLFSHRGHIA